MIVEAGNSSGLDGMMAVRVHHGSGSSARMLIVMISYQEERRIGSGVKFREGRRKRGRGREERGKGYSVRGGTGGERKARGRGSGKGKQEEQDRKVG